MMVKRHFSTVSSALLLLLSYISSEVAADPEPAYQFPAGIIAENQGNPEEARLEAEAKNLETLLKEASQHSNDLSLPSLNLDYGNNAGEMESDSSSRPKRTLGLFYCSIFFSSNPSECPLRPRSGGILRSLFPQNRVAQPPQEPATPQKTEEEFWSNYLQNDNSGAGPESNGTIVLPFATSSTTSTEVPTVLAALKQRFSLRRGLRRLFPRLYSAFSQGYRTGSGVDLDTANLSLNRNGNIPILRALNPFTYLRNLRLFNPPAGVQAARFNNDNNSLY